MEFTALTSGSKGNCFYVQNKKDAILIDVGLNSKQIISRMNQIEINPNRVSAIFITHEHIDHIRGVDVFARKYGVPIYATEKTIKNSFLCKDHSLINPIKNNQKTKIGSLLVESFSKHHNAADPVSYTIHEQNKRVSVITDVGHSCDNIINQVKKAHALFLESNHDINMLLNGPYPAFLKALIRSDDGHLSNTQAALTLLEHASPHLKYLFLSHLSETNNSPDLALKTMIETLSHRQDLSPKIILSQADPLSPLFSL